MRLVKGIVMVLIYHLQCDEYVLYMGVDVLVHMHTIVHTHTHTHTCTCTHTHACAHTHAHIYTHIHAHTCIHINSYTHAHIYTHIYTHTHTNTVIRRFKHSIFVYLNIQIPNLYRISSSTCCWAGIDNKVFSMFPNFLWSAKVICQI